MEYSQNNHRWEQEYLNIVCLNPNVIALLLLELREPLLVSTRLLLLLLLNASQYFLLLKSARVFKVTRQHAATSETVTKHFGNINQQLNI